MAEKKKNSTKSLKAEEKSRKGKRGKDTREDGRDPRQLTFDSPSEKLIHQILPFVFVVVAILLEACFIFATFTGDAYVGVAGVFLKDVFLGLFGFCAFIIPLMLINLAAHWRKFVDGRMVGTKLAFTVLFLISLSGLIHIFIKGSINQDLDAFIKPRQLFEYSYSNIASSGVIGGFVCECVYYLFKSVGSMIIMSALTLIFLVFSLGMTPRNTVIWIRYKWTLMREKREAKREEREEERTELDREEQEKLEGEKRSRIEAQTQEETKRELEADAAKKREDERVAAAERRAIEIEEKERRDRERYGAMRFIDPEPDPQPDKAMSLRLSEPDEARGDESDDEDGRISVSAIFKNPPKEFDPALEGERIEIAAEPAPAAPKKKSTADASHSTKPKSVDAISVDIKEITDIDTVPDDGEEGSVVPESVSHEYVPPTVDLLKDYKNDENEKTAIDEVRANANALMDTLKSFGVRISEITYSRGPTITRYELKPESGVRIRSIANLVDDIALSLATTGVRIEAPIPNKAAVGIEVPNRTPATVGFRSLIDTPEFTEKKSILTAALGKDVGGNTVYFDIGKMPHMLIAGTTGSGKSVCINCIIMSILYKASPRDVKLILIDPKKVEFQPYRSIPHLYAPIVTDPKKAAGALASAVAEMERRFDLIESVGAKNISGYNELTANDPSKEYLPYIVIVIDELADLMMTAADDVETAICRIAQKARAAGIHLIIGTQRPSVDVVTGLIKANIPSRIAFTVASQVDSKTILDTAGADKLIGRGDMLFAPIGSTKPMRVQGAFIDDREVERIVDFINDHNDGVNFNDEFIRRLEEEAAKCGNPKKGGGSFASDDDGEPGEEGVDPKFKLALDVAIEMGKISTSLLQRRLEIGYGRAAKIIDRMEALGYVSAPDGNKPRQVLVSRAEIMEKRINDEE